jgi:hypothetical protein
MRPLMQNGLGWEHVAYAHGPLRDKAVPPAIDSQPLPSNAYDYMFAPGYPRQAWIFFPAQPHSSLPPEAKAKRAKAKRSMVVHEVMGPRPLRRQAGTPLEALPRAAPSKGSPPKTCCRQAGTPCEALPRATPYKGRPPKARAGMGLTSTYGYTTGASGSWVMCILMLSPDRPCASGNDPGYSLSFPPILGVVREFLMPAADFWGCDSPLLGRELGIYYPLSGSRVFRWGCFPPVSSPLRIGLDCFPLRPTTPVPCLPPASPS